LNRRIRKMTRRSRLGILFMIAVVLTASVYLLFASISPILLKDRIDRELEQEHFQIALDLSIKLMQQYPSTKQARESAYIVKRQYLDNSITDIIIGSQFSSRSGFNDGGFAILEEDHDTLFELMALVAEKQVNSMWTQHLYRELGDTASGFKKYNLAEEFYQLAFDGYKSLGKEYWMNEMAIIQLKYFWGRGLYDTARIHLDYLLTHVDDGLMMEAEVHAWNGMFLVEAEQYDEAYTEFTRAKELVNNSLNKNIGIDDGSVAYSQDQPPYVMAEQGLKFIEMIRENGAVGAANSGAVVTLTRNGQPIEGIRGMLRDEPEEGTRSIHTDFYDAIKFNNAVSDSSGQLVFNYVPAGKYDLIFRFNQYDLQGVGAFEIPDTIDVKAGSFQHHPIEMRDKVTVTSPVGPTRLPFGAPFQVAWEEYPGAESYRINYVYYTNELGSLGSSSFGATLGETSDTSFTIDTSSADYRKPITVYSCDEVNPSSILGLFHPESRITVKILALDKDGNTISDSYGLIYDKDSNYPLWIFEYPEDESLLMQGDRFLLKGDYEKAMEAYLTDESGERTPSAQLKADYLKGALMYLDLENN
jgi:tetratricopeptide (TPR) repeat protein